MPIENPDRVLALLNVVEKVTTVAPRCTYLLADAMAELHKLDETIRRTKELEANRPVTPDPVTETLGNTIEPAAGGEQIPGTPTASEPVHEDITTDTPLPEPDHGYDNNEPRRV